MSYCVQQKVETVAAVLRDGQGARAELAATEAATMHSTPSFCGLLCVCIYALFLYRADAQRRYNLINMLRVRAMIALGSPVNPLLARSSWTC